MSPRSATSRRPVAPEQAYEPVNEEAATTLLGQRVRSSRNSRGMSGRELAAAANVTPGFISQLERGLSTPSIATLLRICRVLGLQIGELFTEGQPTSRIIRKQERPTYEMPQAGFEEARISADPRGNIELVWSRIVPGGGTGDELLNHGSETECVFVLKGTIDLIVGEESYTLHTGDCLTFPGDTPHGCFNRTSKNVELLWVTAPAVY